MPERTEATQHAFDTLEIRLGEDLHRALRAVAALLHAAAERYTYSGLTDTAAQYRRWATAFQEAAATERREPNDVR